MRSRVGGADQGVRPFGVIVTARIGDGADRYRRGSATARIGVGRPERLSPASSLARIRNAGFLGVRLNGGMRGRWSRERGALGRGAMLLFLVASCIVVVPGLFWWGTWFGNRLDDAELMERLGPDSKPRAVQHGIEEITRRFEEGRPGMDRWAGELVRVSASADVPVRVAAAWAMQFDPSREGFVTRLRVLLDDPDPLVRRNAATSLARSGDPAALPVLREMLSDTVVFSPAAGTLETLHRAGQPVAEGLLLAMIESDDGVEHELRALLPGRVLAELAERDGVVAKGDELLRVGPSQEHMLHAAMGLALAGTPVDVALLEPLADPRAEVDARLRDVAAAAIRSIESRSEE